MRLSFHVACWSSSLTNVLTQRSVVILFIDRSDSVFVYFLAAKMYASCWHCIFKSCCFWLECCQYDSPHIIHSGWLGSKHHLTNKQTVSKLPITKCDFPAIARNEMVPCPMREGHFTSVAEDTLFPHVAGVHAQWNGPQRSARGNGKHFHTQTYSMAVCGLLQGPCVDFYGKRLYCFVSRERENVYLHKPSTWLFVVLCTERGTVALFREENVFVNKPSA